VPRVHVPVIRWTGVVSMWCASSLLGASVGGLLLAVYDPSQNEEGSSGCHSILKLALMGILSLSRDYTFSTPCRTG
jgi:hypothetical protein